MVPAQPRHNATKCLRRSGALLLACALTACAHARTDEDRRWIHALELRGVHNVDRRALQRGLAVTPTPWWSIFRRHRPYDDLMLDADRERVIRYYRAHGYFNAEVTVAEARPRADGRSFDVVLGVDEGPPTRLDEVRVIGTGKLDPSTKHLVEEAQLALRRGQTLLHARYLALKDELLGIMKARGYPWAIVDGEVIVDRARNTADVELAVDPGIYSRIGRIEIVGEHRALPIEPHWIEETFAIPEGRPFRLSELEEGRARVFHLGFFSSVAMTYTRDPEHPDLTNVRLGVTPTSLHELRFGGGIGIEAQRNEVRLQLLYTKRSFLGGLRTMQLRFRPAYVVLPAVWSPIARHGPAVTGEAIFTQPRLGPFSKLQLTVGYDLGVDYAYQYHGPRAQLAVERRLWHERISLGTSYNFQYLDFFFTSPEILSDPAQAGTRYGYADPYRVAWLQQDVRLDWRDDRLDPRKGMYAEVTAEEGGPYTGGAFTYEKLKLGTRGYLPLGTRVVLAGRVEFAQIWSQGDKGSPTTRRIALGGASSQRGFSEGRLSPQIAVASGPPLPIGGDQSFLVSAEVRADMFHIAGSPLAIAAFVDAGDVGAARGDTVSGWQSGVDWLHLHCAVGGGLRYRTPIGAVRADVGVRVNRVSATESDGRPNPDPGQRVAFHISLSEPF